MRNSVRSWTGMPHGTPSPVDGNDGRAALVIGRAAWESIREQRPVRTTEIG